MNDQSVAASPVSEPLGIRESDPSTVFESATSAGSIVPSTRSNTFVPIVAAVIGFSGHDSGIAMPLAAYVLGARIVEKHFTLNRAMKGTDHAFSLEPVGLRKMVRDLRRTQKALGDGLKKIYASEKAPIIKMGKSLVVARDLPAGHVLTGEDIVMKSPGGGIPPYELEKVLGRVTLKALYEDDFLSFEMLSKPSAELARS